MKRISLKHLIKFRKHTFTTTQQCNETRNASCEIFNFYVSKHIHIRIINISVCTFSLQCNLPTSYITALEIFWRKKEKPWRLDEINYDVQVWNIYLLQSCYVGVLESFAFTVWSIWYNMFFEHINPSYLLSLTPFSYESK